RGGATVSGDGLGVFKNPGRQLELAVSSATCSHTPGSLPQCPLSLILLTSHSRTWHWAQKTQDGQNIGIKHIPATQCGIWVRTSNRGHFASPNYPDSYPPNKECIYILEAAPRQRIELTFDKHYYIEPSFECRFDHLGVQDGPFGFSPLIDCYCDPDFTYRGILNPIPDCQFELSGSDRIVCSTQVEQEEKTKPSQAVDCIWTIKATPKAKL
ncbi:hypothetical protein EI555_002137, partial [Monodon monoceros]